MREEGGREEGGDRGRKEDGTEVGVNGVERRSRRVAESVALEKGNNKPEEGDDAPGDDAFLAIVRLQLLTIVIDAQADNKVGCEGDKDESGEGGSDGKPGNEYRVEERVWVWDAGV